MAHPTLGAFLLKEFQASQWSGKSGDHRTLDARFADFIDSFLKETPLLAVQPGPDGYEGRLADGAIVLLGVAPESVPEPRAKSIFPEGKEQRQPKHPTKGIF